MIFSLPYIFFVVCFFVFYIYSNTKCVGYVERYGLSHFYVVISLFFFIGFRGFIVTDWVEYYKFYQLVPSIRYFSSYWYHGWEKGFIIYASLIKTLTNDFFLFQFISFFIDLMVINKFITENVEKNCYVLAYISFFVFEGFNLEVNLLRNSKAVLLFLLSIPYLEKRKFLVFYLLNILGIAFHISSVVYLFFPFFVNRKFSKWFILCIYLIGNILFLCHISFTNIILSLILKFSGNSRIRNLIIGYDLLSSTEGLGIGFGYLERILLFCLVFLFQDRLMKKNKRNVVFVNMFWGYSFLFLFVFDIYVFCQRFKVLFIPSLWILIPEIFSLIKRRNNKIMFLVVFFLYSCLSMYLQCDEPNYKYSNYLLHEQDYQEAYKNITSYRRLKKSGKD